MRLRSGVVIECHNPAVGFFTTSRSCPQRADRWWLSARLVHSGAVQPRLQIGKVRRVAETLEVLEERAGDPVRGRGGADGQESRSFLIESAREWFGGSEIDGALQLSDRDR